MKEKGQKLKICAKKARAPNKRRVAFLAKIATRWIYFIHIFRQLLVPNLSKSEQKNSVLALGAYYTDYTVYALKHVYVPARNFGSNLESAVTFCAICVVFDLSCDQKYVWLPNQSVEKKKEGGKDFFADQNRNNPRSC